MVRLFAGTSWVMAVALCGNSATSHAQIPGRNVNMVSGKDFVNGDPFLQRQNEPSIAVSTRNVMHLLAGANDYRTVDLPGLPDGLETGDAWLGVFKSFDGGETWTSTLLPGFPQEPLGGSGRSSPIFGYQAGADPVVRAGTHGMFYYSGIAFDREEGKGSSVFVARFIDLNNKERGDPIVNLETVVVDAVREPGSSSGEFFIDKPWIAVDVARSGAKKCRIEAEQELIADGLPTVRNVSQEFRGGAVYIAWTEFLGPREDPIESRIMFSSSRDCGASWSKPKAINKKKRGGSLQQGATIAIDPRDGTVYVGWRSFERVASKGGMEPNAIFIARSKKGKKFDDPVLVRELSPFDQGTSPISFRTTAYPTIAVDESGRLYLAWTERGFAAPRGDPNDGDARVVMATSRDGRDWTEARSIDAPGIPGHQFMPTLAYAAGKLHLTYYDLRDDVSGAFDGFVFDTAALNRHTVDVRAAQAVPADEPAFTFYSIVPSIPSSRASKYLATFNSIDLLQQVQFNPPNLPLFRRGTAAFVGDYIDVAPSPPFLPTGDGDWVYNTDSSNLAVFHVGWTDNRDVRAPPAEVDYVNFTPPDSAAIDPSRQSKFDPTQMVPNCVPSMTGIRNQNIYTSRITEGLYLASPGNAKPLVNDLGEAVQRAFVVFVQNATGTTRSYRIRVANQPPDAPPAGTLGRASFRQFPLPPYDVSSPPAVSEIDLFVRARSSVARTVYVTSSERMTPIRVEVLEIDAPGAPATVGGQAGSLLLNPDIISPDIISPDIISPDIISTEVYTPDILSTVFSNPDIISPDLYSPDIISPDIISSDFINNDIVNPDIISPDIISPDIISPDIISPDIISPDPTNPAVEDDAITDITWVITNNGNTTAAFDCINQLTVPPGAEFKFQSLIYRVSSTPAANPFTCQLEGQTHHQLVANIDNLRAADLLSPDIISPDIISPDIISPDIISANVSSFFLRPGESVHVTLRVKDLDTTDAITFDTTTAAAIAVAQAVDTEDAEAGFRQPAIASSPNVPLQVATSAVSSPIVNGSYNVTLVGLGGEDPYTWEIVGGSLPPGLSFDSAKGQISGTPTGTGSAVVTFEVTDANADTATVSLNFDVAPFALAFTMQPTTSGAGAAIAPAVQVEVRDASGNLISTATDSITLALSPNPGGGTLTGVTTVAAVGGVATFPGLSVDRSGNGYRLVATAPGLAGARSEAFHIVSAGATGLEISTQPTRVTAAATFPIEVTVVDAFGNRRSDASDSITLAIGTNPSGGTLSGTTTVAAVSGRARFTDLSIDLPGSGYTIVAFSPGLVGDSSGPIDVNSFAPTRLVFTSSPTSTAAGGTLTPPVEVSVEDATSSTVTTATDTVTVVIATNPGGGTLSGTRSVAAVNGVATFADLSIDLAGTGYRLAAFADGLDHDTSTAFDVTSGTPILTTVAGSGSFVVGGSGGDGGSATSAGLDTPLKLARDGSGNIFIADSVNHAIRRVDAVSGVITRVAGTGSAGFNGDGIAATSAQLDTPAGVAVDGAGNIFIADQFNQRIRRVDALSGFISTVAGTGTPGFSGDGVATSSQLFFPLDVAVDGSGVVYVADSLNNRVRSLVVGGNITTLAGTGTAGFNGDGILATSADLNSPSAVDVDAAGTILYIADTFNDRIRSVGIGGNIVTVAGNGTTGFSGDGGLATSAALNAPQDVAVDGLGNLYLADTSNLRIRKVSVSSGFIDTVAGGGPGPPSDAPTPATSAFLDSPSGVAVPASGTFFLIADSFNHRIRRVQ